MPGASSIQHKASFKNEAGFAFEDGSLVPITSPETATDETPDNFPRPATLDACQLLATILRGAKNTQEIAARALICGSLMGCPSAPKTATEFALALDVPRSSGQRLWARLFEYLQGELAVFGQRSSLVDERNQFAANAAGAKPD